MKCVIVSGRSGAGKSMALHTLEDLSYHCIDNIPVDWLLDLKDKLDAQYDAIAVSVDIRNLPDPKFFETIYPTLKTQYDPCEVLFLDAADEVLIKRFSETRRKHPLTDSKINLLDALKKERYLLKPVIDVTDLLIDTSRLNIHDLRQLLRKHLQTQKTQLSILFQSFGFKHGAPIDTDFIFDVRCLPNPHWEKELQPKTGLDKEVIQYLENFKEVKEMFKGIQQFLKKWIPVFDAENRKYLTISIGCTGGQHRSVYFAQKLSEYFSPTYPTVTVRHRDLEK